MNLDQNVYVAHLNAVRKSWADKVPALTKAQFGAMPQAERFEHYKRVDNAVKAIHTGFVLDAREAGVKVNEAKSKELLENASQIVVDSLVNGTFAA